MSNSAPKSNGLSRIITMTLITVVVVMTLLLGWQALLESGLLLVLGLIAIVLLLLMLREGLNFVMERLGLWVRGQSGRLKDAQTPAQDMAGQIGRSLKTRVNIASMEDTGQYIHVLLHIGTSDEKLIEEMVVIPHAHVYNPEYWDQMTQGIINYNRERISIPA